MEGVLIGVEAKSEAVDERVDSRCVLGTVSVFERLEEVDQDCLIDIKEELSNIVLEAWILQGVSIVL